MKTCVLNNSAALFFHCIYSSCAIFIVCTYVPKNAGMCYMYSYTIFVFHSSFANEKYIYEYFLRHTGGTEDQK